jgi:hypothetical protein
MSAHSKIKLTLAIGMSLVFMGCGDGGMLPPDPDINDIPDGFIIGPQIELSGGGHSRKL